MNNVWTDERVNALETLWATGASASMIGRRMGLTKNQVLGKVHRLKLPSRPSPIKRTDAGKYIAKKLHKGHGSKLKSHDHVSCPKMVKSVSGGSDGQCRNPKIPGQTYCAYHQSVCYGVKAAA